MSANTPLYLESESRQVIKECYCKECGDFVAKWYLPGSEGYPVFLPRLCTKCLLILFKTDFNLEKNGKN